MNTVQTHTTPTDLFEVERRARKLRAETVRSAMRGLRGWFGDRRH